MAYGRENNSGTYMYFKGEPQWPFGYGLSYTTFTYANLRTDAAEMKRDGTVNVSLDLTNTGHRDGAEVVQLYVRYPDSKVPRPLKQLRGFQRVWLREGQGGRVVLPLTARDLSYWSPQDHTWVLEPGREPASWRQ